jgi:hypothetical protein
MPEEPTYRYSKLYPKEMRKSYRRSTNSPIVFGENVKERFSDYLEEPFQIVEEAEETPEKNSNIEDKNRRNNFLNAPGAERKERRSRFYKASSNTDDDKKIPLEREIDTKISTFRK